MTSLSRANAITIAQDDTAWIVGNRTASPRASFLMHYHLGTRAVLSVTTVNIPQPAFLTGIEVYGSRGLVCNQTSPTAVTVNVHSKHPQAGGEQYALAASLARRPGIQMSNSEWLNLATDPLFYLSALGAWPSIFTNFQGQLDAFGNATAHVNIPALPPNLGIPVFVAGVIFDKNGVLQVTNTHWFVLP